jgi:hypothetical protein
MTPPSAPGQQPGHWVDLYISPSGRASVLELPSEIQRALNLRHIALDEGACPDCGAPRIFGTRRQRRAGLTGPPHVHHRPGCPAGDRALAEATVRWEATWAR